MSWVMGMRADLFAAFLHYGSRWSGDYDAVIENCLPVCIYMMEDDEYYGPERAREAYNTLCSRYREEGLTEKEIESLVSLHILDREFLSRWGFTDFYMGGHMGGHMAVNDSAVMDWIMEQHKQEDITTEDTMSVDPTSGNTTPIPEVYYEEAQQQGTLVTIEYEAVDRAGSGERIQKPATIYLPYGYDDTDSDTKYNIFYMMHGWTGNAEVFFHYDNSNTLKNILDHMIENGDIEPLIVVTPTFDWNNASNTLEESLDQIRVFHEELLEELIPAVEGQYHTYAETTDPVDLQASRDHRAFGGFSLGAAVTWNVFLNDMDYFRYYLPMSGSCFVLQDRARDPEISRQTAEYLVNYLKDSSYQNDDFFIYTSVGSEDVSFDMTDNLATVLFEHPDMFSDSNVQYQIHQGAVHDWSSCPEKLYNGLPLFFRDFRES